MKTLRTWISLAALAAFVLMLLNVIAPALWQAGRANAQPAPALVDAGPTPLDTALDDAAKDIGEIAVAKEQPVKVGERTDLDDPLKNPALAYKDIRDQAERVSMFSAIALAVYLLGGALLRQFKSASWLAQGRRLAAVTSVVTVAGAIVDATVGIGGFYNVAAQALLAVALVLAPQVPIPPPQSTPPAEA